ncbi:hypothetical protein K445DRAFT_9769 [Daldinia sp. EC12]|nr:hypothetical protein K445DRAFT_9769 [Daldinia sp. EC12]
MDILALERLPLLDACINEALRLYPVVPTGGIRQTTDRGIMIDGKWIPPYTVIVAPRWSIGRLASAFEKPDEFVPERWTTRPEMVKDARAFNAFGLGRHVCPGKKLGTLIVRLAAAMVLSNFELYRDPSNKEQAQVLGDMQDCFTSQPGRLDIVFKPLAPSSKSYGNI